MKYIVENCERNNMVILSGIQKDETTLAIANYCRYDRHVRVEPYGDGKYYVLSCVLYDNKPRKDIK